MSDRNFFSELRRRNVYKVAVVYAVTAWLLIQAASILLPTFEAPAWVMKVVVMVVVLGFPVALILAWAFELTPEGIKRTEDADPFDSRSGQALPGDRISKNRTWIYVAVIGAAFSIGLFFVGRYTGIPREDGRSSATFLPEKSIAVLPFANLSRDPDNAYFAEGVQDEILTRLAKIADLKVISRTSTQRFKSASENLPEIAKQLGVINILEGSVQKSGDQVRVSVQLINALTDAHLWAEIYDRKLTDIFAVESDIAKTIADTLQAKLTGSEKNAIARKPTADPQAYELYLKGRFFWNKRTGADLKTGIEYFKQAIAKDPKYALAYAGLADCYGLLTAYGAARPDESYPLAKIAAQKALELDDSLGEAHASLGQVLMLYEFDFQASTNAFQRAFVLSPNYATAHQWYGIGPPMISGDFDTAIAELKRAIELDPLSLIINTDFGFLLMTARRYDEAIAQFRKTIEMDPHFYYAHWNLGTALEMKGELDAAFAAYKRAAELDDDPFVAALIARAYAKLGQREEALKRLENLKALAAQRYVSHYGLALGYIATGDHPEAIDWLERAYRDRAGTEIVIIKVDPLLDPLRGDPRFEALVQKVFAKQ